MPSLALIPLCGVEGGAHIYIKGVTVRFGFDVLELRNFRQIVKNKATGTPHGMFIYNPHWSYVFMTSKGNLYTHQRGAFDVARFDNLGNAKALTRGTSDRTGSTFFMHICFHDYSAMSLWSQ